MADTPVIQLDEAEILADDSGKDVKEEQEVTQDTSAEDSSSNETKETPEVPAEPTPEAEEGDAQTDEKPEKEEPKEDEAEDTATEEEQPKPGGAEERKTNLNGEIRDLVAQRNAIKQEVERLNAQAYQPQTVQDLVNEGYSEQEARLNAMEQRQEIRDYNDRIAEKQLTISSESERVLNDFPIFNPNSDQYVQEVATQAADILRSALVTDPNTGQIIDSNVSPYQLYKTIANANQVSTNKAQVQGQRDAEKMLAAADPVSSAPPKEKKEDPFLTGLLGN